MKWELKFEKFLSFSMKNDFFRNNKNFKKTTYNLHKNFVKIANAPFLSIRIESHAMIELTAIDMLISTSILPNLLIRSICNFVFS